MTRAHLWLVLLLGGFGMLLSGSAFAEAAKKKGKRWVFVPVVPHTASWNPAGTTLECSFYNVTAVYASDFSRDNRQVFSVTTLSPQGAKTNAAHFRKDGNRSETFEVKINESYTKDFIGDTFPKGLIISVANKGEGTEGKASAACVFYYKEGSSLFAYPVPVNGGDPF